MLMGRAAAICDELADFDLESLELRDHGDAVVEIHRLLDKVEAVRTHAVDRWDATNGWAAENAKSAASWLRCRAQRPGPEASVTVRRARKLRTTPKVAWSFLQGRIGGARVDALLAVRSERTAELFERDEDLLVDHAETLRFDDLLTALRRWLQLADPDGPDPADKQWKRRRFDHSETLLGTWNSDGRWDAVTGEEIDTAVTDEYDRLFKQDWAEAKQRLGRSPLVEELERTPGQRRADALVALVRRGHAAAGGEVRR